MAPKPDVIAREWFLRGDKDMRNATILYEHGGSYEGVCFLCQQAAEKYLKGFLAGRKKGYKFTHDLYLTMKECCELDKEFSSLEEFCRSLTTYYIETRYPTTVEDYTKKDSEEAVEAASRIIAFVKDKTSNKTY
jgi:HEPN domain-containing protein